MSEKIFVIIPAAGLGQRMQSCLPKQYMKILGKTVLEHSIAPFLVDQQVTKVILVLSSEDKYWRKLNLSIDCDVCCVSAGQARYDSVMAGLVQLVAFAKANDWVVVHDAVRPCLRKSDWLSLVDELRGHAIGGLLATPVRDTLKLATATQTTEKTVSRINLWRALTPQMYRFGVLYQTMLASKNQVDQITDEASALELQGYQSKLVQGSQDNIKITLPGDLEFAQLILKARLCQ